MVTSKPKYLVAAAAIGAIYATLTLVLAPISFGPMQVRVAEALCILPFFTTAAVPGLFIGCLISNAFGIMFGTNLGVLDVIIGSLATLASAYIASKLKNKWLIPLPAVIINAFAVGLVLYIMLQLPYFINVLWVGIGQTVACYGIGIPLMLLLNKYRKRIFGEV